MATVQKKPRKLPKITKDEDDDPKGRKGGARGDASRGTKRKELPPPERKKELPPLRRGGKKDSDSKSMVEMGRKSPVDVHQRTSLTANNNARSCYFYIDGNYKFPPIKLVIHPTKHRKMDTVTRDLSNRMKALPFGVRSIFTPRAKHRIHTLEELTQDGNYVCSTNRTYAKGIDVQRVQSKNVWHHMRPDSGRRTDNKYLRDYELPSAKQRANFRPGYDLSKVYTRNTPKKITVMKNNFPNEKSLLLLNRRTAQTYEQVLKTLCEKFGFAVRKLYTIEGEEINRSLQKLLDGPDVIVACGTEPFKQLDVDYLGQSRAHTRLSRNMGSNLNLRSRMQSRRHKLSNTQGRWKVTVRTSSLPSVGTQAQVTLTVYGNKNNSGAITLGRGDGKNFQPGNMDEFDISVGNVGEIYKIRLAHDNSGDFPGWLCDEVHMHDVDSGEDLTFSCHRWLARDEDDQEITRELAVKRPGDPILPLIKYQVDVITGDMWGGGTDANIYITLYGDRGDTGVRQLYAETKGVYFKQGQLDSFEVEAVSLGHLKRIIIGHDGTGPGSGWFLDKVIIREPPFRPNQEHVFYCGKWLDEGEDDGKIVRELRVQDEYMDDILEKRNWEFEKWKYDHNGQVMLYSVMTGKALRLNKDQSVDAVGGEKDKHAVLNVIPKKPMKPMFASAANPNRYLAIDSGRITALGKGGPYCEFRVRVQQDRTTLIESVKNPLQFITIGADGSPADVRGILDKEPTRRFYVYAKGCFRHRGIILLCTSQYQCLNINKDDYSLTGRGKRQGPLGQFRVHKISSGGIRMFESMAEPGNFIRLKDGKIDCKGKKDPESYFLVLRHKDKGYITLQSATQRGLFLGMTPEGKVHTTIDTGVRNICLYPEVVEWGVRKKESHDQEEEGRGQVRQDMSPVSEVAASPKPSRQFAEGDWGINVSTINELTNGDVALVAYGDKGNSGPIILGAPPGKQIFQDGNEDEFRANLLKIGQMYKIRLELVPKSSTRDPHWKVKEVRMQDLNSNEILRFNFNRWLSRQEDDHDIMRELPVQRPGETVLQVHKYVVSVYTGKEIGAETDAEVYITLHGERGDWGRRILLHSNNNNKFRTGQVDIFHVEAVSLGNLQRCVIGHDGTGVGEGWYLEQVIIKENEHATDEYVFPCTRWLDSGLEDRKLERTLMVKETSPSKTRRGPSAASSVTLLEKIEEEKSIYEAELADGLLTNDHFTGQDLHDYGDKSEIVEKKQEPVKAITDKGQYSLEVMTEKDSSPSDGGRVHITLYGEHTKSDQIMLYAADPNKKTFEPGNIDQFTLETEYLGELYKLRLGREDNDKWDGWFLGEVRLTDENTGEKMTFSFNRWLARDMDDGDLCRELPVVKPGKPFPSLMQYKVQVYTGDHWGAGTDANMYIILHGSHGDSGKRLLHTSPTNRVKFQRGQMDTFVFDVVDLEDLTSVIVSHDGRGHGAGVFIDKVVVMVDGSRSHIQHVFPCGRWLDDHEDNCLTHRTLRMIDEIDTTKPVPAREAKRSSGNWSVTVKTSSIVKAPTTARVYLTMYGTSGHSDPLPLHDTSSDDVFTAGSRSQFQVSAGDLGKITKVRLEHDNSGTNPDWRVDYVKLEDMDTHEELVFYVDRWLALDQDDGHIVREMPVIRKGTPSLPVLRYLVAVTTGSYKDAGSDSGTVSINLIGVDGDTGLRELTGPISKNRLPWQSGQTDIFVLEAVCLGKIKKMELNFNSGAQDRWYVQQVSVSEGSRALTQSVCYCHQWILASDTQRAEFTVTEITPSTSLIDRLDSIPRSLEKTVKTKGRWTVYVQTGTQNDSGTKEQVCLVLCGLKAESTPVCINSKDELNPGSFVKFEAKVSEIGLLFKVRVYFADKHHGSSWFLSKMKLKDQDTGEELHFEHNDWIESTNENPEGAIELPVVRPDLQPLKEQIYIVSVKTGDLPRAETEASVYCHLIGQWGSTGQRSLSISSNKDMFRPGQTDEYTLTSIDLGEVQKVLIGHDTVGRGQGWLCQSVSVKVAEDTETVFPCNRWLDTGCDDRKLHKELLPLSRLPISYHLPTKYTQSKDSKWNFHITTASTDRLPSVSAGQKSGDISIVVYGRDSVKGPLELIQEDNDSPLHILSPGIVDHFYNYELEDIGEIEKIRVSYGYEGDTQAVWTIQQVVLEDQKSSDKLTFDFGGWVGEVGGDIRKEMPLVLPDKSNRQVVKYYIEVHTSEAEMHAATNSNVFITLYGYNSDSGRRHLIRSHTNKRFQPGQVDKFELEAVDLGDLERLVVAKGPGKPWLLEKIVVKKGEFASDEHVFLFEGWIGDKKQQDVEIEETIKLTASIPSHVAIPYIDAPDIDISNGSWTIEGVTGGRRGPDGPMDVVVVFCGQEAETKPLPLDSNRENPFQIGQSDIFKVKYSEKIGDLRKVRFGFTDQSVTKAWYIRKVTFEDNDSHDMFWADINDWVAIDNKLDGWKEVPVPWPAVQLAPVIKYVVSVHVGEVNKDWSDNDIYMYIYGEYGGTGRRSLKHSISNEHIIKENQVDIFEVEAVHLGDLVKVVVGHSNTAKGCGWYLERVTIQESPDAKQVLFECNRWLDAGEADNEIERTLYPIQMYQKPDDDNSNNNNNMETDVIVPIISPKPSLPDLDPTPRDPTPDDKTPVESPDMEIQTEEEQRAETQEEPTIQTAEILKTPTPLPQGSRWSITTTTGGDAGEGTGSAVVIVLYGDRGHSTHHVIGEGDFRFTMGNTDTFNITVEEDIGELFKVRLGFAGDDPVWFTDIDQSPTWFIEKLTLKNLDDEKVYEFMADLWVKVSEYQDFWRELPVKKDKDTLEVYQYKVSVYTGDESKSGTNANVYLQVFGECGDTGYRKLMTSKTHTDKFEQGNKDIFELGAVDLGKLIKIKIRHDGSGPGSGWLLDRIVIQETEDTTIRYVFRYERWLDEGDGENGVEQTLMLSEILVSDEQDKTEDLPGYPWQVETVTGDGASEGTSCPVELVLCEFGGACQTVVIGEKEGFRFNTAAHDTFNVRIMETIKDLYKVRIGFNGAENELGWFQNYSLAPTWMVQKLKLTDESSGKVYEIQMPTWVKVDQYQDYWREQPAIRPNDAMPEVYDYQVEVYTSDKSKAGTDANVFLTIYGQTGDTGSRRLVGSKTHSNKFEQGNCDLFEINAVDLGDLTKVKVSHDGAGMGSGWYIDKIVVKETEQNQTKYVFMCGEWMDVAEGETTVAQEFPLTQVQDGMEEEPETKGNPWTIYSVTGDDVGEGTNNPIDLILYGFLGQSSPVVIGGGENFRFDRGQVDVFEVKVQEEIGELYKVRVGFHGDKYDVPWYQNYHLAPSWFIESLKLKNDATGEEFELEGGVSVQVEKYHDFWRELPVVNTDDRLKVYKYHVEVYTGEKFQAGTDANVSVQIYGEQGDTGLRRLMESKTNSNKFEGGEKDVFEVPAVDLGKLTKVKVTHDGSGAGSGWLLDKVVVMETETSTTQFVFNCGQWLDEGEGDKDVEIIIPLSEVTEVKSEVKVEEPNTDNYKVGDWKVYITTHTDPDSGTDSNVTLTVYGDADNTGPIALGDPSTGFFYSGKTDEFEVFLDPEELGQLRKIRLEHDNSGKAWQVEKVKLVNMVDKSEIEFLIDKWLTLGERGFDIAVEVPTKGHNWPVRDYVLQTETGNGFGSGTDATVYANLVGTLGDSGKRFLVHNIENTEEKFQSGKDTFVIQAVDLGRLREVQIGHTGKGPGSGWFLKSVTVKEDIDAKEKHVFKCERWLHDEKDDGLTERVLSVDHVEEDNEPFVTFQTHTDNDHEQTHTDNDHEQTHTDNDHDGEGDHEHGDTTDDVNRAEEEEGKDTDRDNDQGDGADDSENVTQGESETKPDTERTDDENVEVSQDRNELENVDEDKPKEESDVNDDNNDEKENSGKTELNSEGDSNDKKAPSPEVDNKTETGRESVDNKGESKIDTNDNKDGDDNNTDE